MTRFQKLLREQAKADRHLWNHVGFVKIDKSIQDYNEIQQAKSAKIYKQTKGVSGGWASQLGRI